MGESARHEIHLLTDAFRRERFDCGKAWLNTYIRQHALKNQELGYGKTYVAIREGGDEVDGYFTLSMGSVIFQNLPEELCESVPKYPMPVAHLGCLAVSNDHQGNGLGSILLIEAFTRVLAASDLVAARSIEVKAIDEQALAWYLRRGFKPFVDHPMHLYLPLATIRQALVQL